MNTLITNDGILISSHSSILTANVPRQRNIINKYYSMAEGPRIAMNHHFLELSCLLGS